jgi:PAS domain S-box-containing protein
MTRDRHVTGPDDGQHAAELLELGDAFCEVDHGWRLLAVNRNQERLFGRPRGETLGRVLWELWPEAANPGTRYWVELHRCMRERVAVQFQDFHAPLDLWTGVTAYPVSAGGIAIFLRDITALKRAEESLRARELEASRRTAEVEAILGSVADGVLVYDREGRIVESNATADRILGYDARERALPIGERLASAGITWLREDGTPIAPDDMPVLRAARHGETHRARLLRMLRPGREQWIALSAGPLVVGGAQVGSVVTLSDLTERRRTEEALDASEQRFRMLSDAMPQIVCVLQPGGGAEYVNPGWTAYSGLDLAETTRLGWYGVLHPDDREAATECRRRVLKSRAPQDVELRYRAADGSFRWFLSRLAPVVEGDRVVRLIGSAMDIEDRKRAEEAVQRANETLRDADRRKDEFLGMLSHELRNPLAPIRNSLYILDRLDATALQARRAKAVANRQVTHLTRLVDDLLDVTRIARGKIELRKAELDLGALARRTAEDHRALMQERRLELSVEVPAGPVPVRGDETRLAQVIGNLLHNAAKFTPAGGRVTLAVAVEEGRVAIHVRDTGAGIAPEALGAIFEPFTQAKQTLARSEGGLGLGLALVKGLVAMHGGEVSASSGGAGRGSDFAVMLPLASLPPVREGERVLRGAPVRARRRVLVIDDNRDAADSLAELVSMLGHRADVAYDGFAGLARAAEAPPDVVLCDIGLPGMDGYECARQLRALSPSRDLRLVAVSGYAQPEDIARAMEAGFDAHVAKPPDPERLAGLLSAGAGVRT